MENNTMGFIETILHENHTLNENEVPISVTQS